ncbi:MAG: gliding motility-associated lipoprotein [Bacteroidetes bacterium]|nr:MAG: gliding motility-associated lipoprotein [Bacteroidota bacterium]
MKQLFFVALVALTLVGCKNSGNGELIGVTGRSDFYQSAPYGMAFVPMASYTMGTGDQDAVFAHVHEPKTVSVPSFYMDETEITNNEYRQFVYWVRDSIARHYLGEVNEEDYLITENEKTGEVYDPPHLNWDTDIDWQSDEEDARDALEVMYVPDNERFFGKKEIDARKLIYEYYWVDLQSAARKEFATDNRGLQVANSDYPSERAGFANRPEGYTDRSVYVRSDNVHIYPDTLCWIHDFTYSYNEPMTRNYFWHPAYDNYPVVGVNWKQARAFAYWRTALMNTYLHKHKEVAVNEFRLPTEAEWEWAARGGWDMNPYPWGGPYLTNERGCFLANFKPNRGNYISDGGMYTVIVGHYPANDWGLYDMAGNVSEWTISAYDESSYNFTWDLNPNYEYNASEEDSPMMKKKVIRGGSWKDIGYYLQVTARQYEFQDTAKSYIGFRCIQTYLGRMEGDSRKASEVY